MPSFWLKVRAHPAALRGDPGVATPEPKGCRHACDATTQHENFQTHDWCLYWHSQVTDVIHFVSITIRVAKFRKTALCYFNSCSSWATQIACDFTSTPSRKMKWCETASLKRKTTRTFDLLDLQMISNSIMKNHSSFSPNTSKSCVYTGTSLYIYIYIYICVCVCVFANIYAYILSICICNLICKHGQTYPANITEKQGVWLADPQDAAVAVSSVAVATSAGTAPGAAPSTSGIGNVAPPSVVR